MSRPVDALDARLMQLFADEPRVGVLEASRRIGVARGTVQARLDRPAAPAGPTRPGRRPGHRGAGAPPRGTARGPGQARRARLAATGVITGWGPQVNPTALGHPVTAFLTL